MRTDLFSSPFRKYHVNLSDEVKQSVFDYYQSQKFKESSPFFVYDEYVQELLGFYVESLDEFRDEVYPIGTVTITSASLAVLRPGDFLYRDTYLPGHFAAVHYIKYDESKHQADLYYHPAYDVLNCVKPETITNELDAVKGLWVKEGDLVIYPSYIETSSPINTSTEERITLMFTFVVTHDEYSRESGTKESSK